MIQLENRVQELETTISSLLKHMDKNFGIVNDKIDALRGNSSIANGFEKVDKNFGIVNDKIDALRGNSTASIETVENKLTDLKVEIAKINEVTSYEGIFNNAFKIAKLP